MVEQLNPTQHHAFCDRSTKFGTYMMSRMHCFQNALDPPDQQRWRPVFKMAATNSLSSVSGNRWSITSTHACVRDWIFLKLCGYNWRKMPNERTKWNWNRIRSFCYMGSQSAKHRNTNYANVRGRKLLKIGSKTHCINTYTRTKFHFHGFNGFWYKHEKR